MLAFPRLLCMLIRFSVFFFFFFLQTKRDQLMVKVTRFYRPEDVPEESYSLLLQDRKEDTSLNHEVLNALQSREIFLSDTPFSYSICSLRFVFYFLFFSFIFYFFN